MALFQSTKCIAILGLLSHLCLNFVFTLQWNNIYYCAKIFESVENVSGDDVFFNSFRASWFLIDNNYRFGLKWSEVSLQHTRKMHDKISMFAIWKTGIGAFGWTDSSSWIQLDVFKNHRQFILLFYKVNNFFVIDWQFSTKFEYIQNQNLEELHGASNQNIKQMNYGINILSLFHSMHNIWYIIGITGTSGQHLNRDRPCGHQFNQRISQRVRYLRILPLYLANCTVDLTHCALVTHLAILVLVNICNITWWHQAITQTNVDLASPVSTAFKRE